MTAVWTWKAWRICLFTWRSKFFTFSSFSVFPLKVLQQNPPFHLPVQQPDSKADVIPAKKKIFSHKKSLICSPLQSATILSTCLRLLAIGEADVLSKLFPLLVVDGGQWAHLWTKCQYKRLKGNVVKLRQCGRWNSDSTIVSAFSASLVRWITTFRPSPGEVAWAK